MIRNEDSPTSTHLRICEWRNFKHWLRGVRWSAKKVLSHARVHGLLITGWGSWRWSSWTRMGAWTTLTRMWTWTSTRIVKRVCTSWTGKRAGTPGSTARTWPSTMVTSIAVRWRMQEETKWVWRCIGQVIRWIHCQIFTIIFRLIIIISATNRYLIPTWRNIWLKQKSEKEVRFHKLCNIWRKKLPLTSLWNIGGCRFWGRRVSCIGIDFTGGGLYHGAHTSSNRAVKIIYFEEEHYS